MTTTFRFESTTRVKVQLRTSRNAVCPSVVIDGIAYWADLVPQTVRETLTAREQQLLVEIARATQV